MKVKSFTSHNVNEAMAQVKKELGLDAVILHIRRFRKGGLFGFFGKEMVEVMAAVDSNPLPVNRINQIKKPAASLEKTGSPKLPAQEKLEEAQVEFLKSEPSGREKMDGSSPEKTERAKPPAREKFGEAQVESLKSEISSIKKMMEQFIGNSLKVVGKEEDSPLIKMLLKNDVAPDVAASLVKGIPKEQALIGLESDAVKQVLTERIVQYLKNIEGIDILPQTCKKVAFIGPTGVGKTTTIAKLAANFTIKQGYKVAVITADTYRIAAIEQLRIYADIIGIPLEIVYSPEELKAAFNRHRDKDLILLDSAGRSPNNFEQLTELKALLDVDPSIETHLVLSAAIRYTEAIEIIKKFSICSPEKILFTKIDESCTLGTLLNIFYYFPSTLSYITTGQSVPEDIELADSNKLASLMLKDF